MCCFGVCAVNCNEESKFDEVYVNDLKWDYNEKYIQNNYNSNIYI